MPVTVFPYEIIGYQGLVAPYTSPIHMAMCSIWQQGPRARLLRFRYAEMGCGDGTNLLPLAFFYPASTFMGIDYSPSALERARGGARELGLENIDFILKDVRDLEPNGFEPCDYIVAHGLYSWVPEDARNSILTFCRQSLTASGLAYISYNAQPGWATRRLVRETLLRARTVREAPMKQKAQRAIEVAQRLLEDLPSRDYASAVILANELERVRDAKPYYVHHEFLAERNDGFWLGEFVDRARQHGLDYIGDAQACRWEGYVAPELRAALAKRGLDRIEQEETADLLSDRYFRASLLCRQDAPRKAVSHRDLLETVYVAGALHGPAAFDLREGVVERFQGAGGREVTLDGSLTKAAVRLLAAQWPAGMRFEMLYQKAWSWAQSQAGPVSDDGRAQLANDLLTLFDAGQIDLRLQEPVYSREIPDNPRAHALARFEAEHRDALTTPYHLPIPFDPAAMTFVRELDGSRSRRDLERDYGEDLVMPTLETLARWGLLKE